MPRGPTYSESASSKAIPCSCNLGLDLNLGRSSGQGDIRTASVDVTGRDGDGSTQGCRRVVKNFVCSDGDGGAKS
jgi:hypothetical protein